MQFPKQLFLSFADVRIMNPAVTTIACFSAGVSTSHYLYLSMAAEGIGNNDAATQEARERLKIISGHEEIVAQCLFPERDSAQEFLVRISQSTPYQYRLLKHPAVANSVLDCLQSFLGDQVEIALKLEPERSFKKAHRLNNISKALAALFSSRNCFAKFARLVEPPTPFENWLDTIQPLLHQLIGALMIAEPLLERKGARCIETSTEGQLWNHFLFDSWLDGVAWFMQWFLPKIENITHGAWVDPDAIKKGTVVGGGIAEMFAAIPPEFEEAAIVKEVEILVSVLLGLEEGTKALEDFLTQLRGDSARILALSALRVREDCIAPVIKKFERLGSEHSTPPS